MTKPKNRDTLYIRKIPLKLKRKFRSILSRRGETMQDVIRDFMQEYVEYNDEIKGGDNE